jgi:foldase protein PrsA
MTITRAKLYPPLAALLALCALGLLSACGSSHATDPKSSSGAASTSASQSSSSKSTVNSSPPALSPSAAVASVAGHPILWADVKRLMAAGQEKVLEVPEPPNFNACAARRSAGGSQSQAKAKAACKERFEELLKSTLGTLINERWLVGEAREGHLKVNQGPIDRELATIAQVQGKAMAASGLTLADAKRELLVTALTDLMLERVKERTPAVDGALMASYYAANKRRYALPEERDLHIIRTASEASALKVKREAQAGKSFASLVKGIALPQPIETKEGTFHGLQPHFFSEPVLADAIFKARPHVISGPVKISLGYYVFEVIAVHPPHQRSLAEVEPELRRELPEKLHRKELAKTVAEFRAKWTPRTSCAADFVIQGCRGYRAPAGAPADRYTF